MLGGHVSGAASGLRRRPRRGQLVEQHGARQQSRDPTQVPGQPGRVAATIAALVVLTRHDSHLFQAGAAGEHPCAPVRMESDLLPLGTTGLRPRPPHADRHGDHAEIVYECGAAPGSSASGASRSAISAAADTIRVTRRAYPERSGSFRSA